MKLTHKYVLHIPAHKNKTLEKIDMDEPLNKLIKLLKREYTSFYKQEATGYYKDNMAFGEVLITIFTKTEQESPEKLFRKWYKEHNSILEQEAYAYEHDNTIIIEKL